MSLKSTALILATTLVAVTPLMAPGAQAAEEANDEPKELLSAATFKGLELRGIGPAVASGRIGDFAVHPTRPSTYYVAVSSGGVYRRSPPAPNLSASIRAFGAWV